VAYRIRYCKRARNELDECCETYGQDLREGLLHWLRQIAEQPNEAVESLDVGELLKGAILGDALRQWRHSWKKLWTAAGIERFRALYYAIRKRQPPWQLKMTVRWFHVLDQFWAEVHVHFAVDHMREEVIIVKFDGLPGQ
jgi:hypothetical protein